MLDLEGLLERQPVRPDRGLFDGLHRKRRVLRETVQARAVRQVCTHIDAPCCELPYYNGLEKDTAAIEALSEALLETI